MCEDLDFLKEQNELLKKEVERLQRVVYSFHLGMPFPVIGGGVASFKKHPCRSCQGIGSYVCMDHCSGLYGQVVPCSSCGGTGEKKGER